MGFEEREPNTRLDELIWLFHRAWVDRYGADITNKAGIERWRGAS